MEQLRMYWRSNGQKYPIDLEDAYYIESYKGQEDIESWISLTSYDLQDIILNKEDFNKQMLSREGVLEENIFFISRDKEKVATVTAIIYPERKEGYVHMVACSLAHRQRGLGKALINLALNTFIDKGINFATLKTDSHRLPAIKTYLRAGFLPILYDDKVHELWLEIMKEINIKSLDGLDDKGKFIRKLEI